MKILSMTATFGKLNRKTLTLQPGLNIIEAPNESGKSTWCAFIVAMLYGIDTSQRTTQTSLADKEHYAPWSGQPMSGRMELLWNGKAITIERSTKGRIPMGEFSAYETESGLPVAELNAENCGQVLLGVERSVFLRAGFIRQSDMPVTQDDALRRRLNALVTTGDENDAGDQLAEKLKDLKNRCQHKKTGALPAAMAQRAALLDSLEKLAQLRAQLEQITQQQQLAETQLAALENHKLALAYDNAQEGLYRLQMAEDARQLAEKTLQQLREQTNGLPARQEISDRLAQLRQLLSEKDTLLAQPSPSAPAQPQAPEVFAGMTPEEAIQQARNDKAAHDEYSDAKPYWLPIGAVLCFLAAAGLSLLWAYALIPGLLAALALAGIYYGKLQQKKRLRSQLLIRYGTLPPDTWLPTAQWYQAQAAQFQQQDSTTKAMLQLKREQLETIAQKLLVLTDGLSPEEAEAQWLGILILQDRLQQAEAAALQAGVRAADLQASIPAAAPPAAPDTMTISQQETDAQIALLTQQLQQLQLQAGKCMGQIDALGREELLQKQLQQLEERIQKLEDLYYAATLALAHLEQATLQLQQRFAPQLTARARTIFASLTGGRYDRLQLDQQLQLKAAAEDEDSLQPARWRSDGTIDQLYLALRLAVAEQLTPTAPLVLDDVLVRFDDLRHTAAMNLLAETAEHKQVLIFTCQSREAAYSPENIIEI